MLKIKAYTLMEVTIAMLISAICITICYTAYSLIGSYYEQFAHKNKEVAEFLALKEVLENDFVHSNYIGRTENGLVLQQDSVVITYEFTDKLMRKLGEQQYSVFDLKFEGLQTYFEGNEVLQTDTIDRVAFRILFEDKKPVNLVVVKQYSAQNLFH